MHACDLQANGRFARKQKARSDMFLRACAFQLYTVVCAAYGYQRGASTYTGVPPPVGAPGQGTPPFSEIFFIFFEKNGEHK